jgi:hypothetical protein
MENICKPCKPSRLCQEPECKKSAGFNFKGKNKMYCSEHKQEGMVDVVHNMCQENGCGLRAGFNFLGKKNGIYCVNHKKENMVDVTHKTCLECGLRANFNFKGKKNGIYCETHKKENMVDVTHKTCLECDLRPNFNFKGKKSGLYCESHKKEGMVDVLSKKCQEHNCEKSPTFNFKGKTAIYCGDHKKEGMVNVKDKMCQESNCETIPIFNFKGKKGGIYCETHKKENMVDVRHQTCLDCELRAGFNFKGNTKGIYCGIHKKEGMVDVVHKMCLTEHCEIRGSKKFENYCLFCFINTFPDKPVAKNYKTKEKAVSDYIKQEFSEFTLITDKKLEGGCSRRRPDILLDLGYQVIIIEIDENQHEDYICENKRIMEISQDLGHRPVVFIRFNPDAYKTPQGNITGCWGPNGKGILVVKKSKQKEWSERLETLKETVKIWLNNQTQKTIEMVHLFYDKLS